MKGGAAILLAILLGVFLAVGQCGSGSADEKDDDSHSSSSASDDHDDEQASDDDDDDSDDDKKDDKDDDDESDDAEQGLGRRRRRLEPRRGHEAAPGGPGPAGPPDVHRPTTTAPPTPTARCATTSPTTRASGVERAWYEVGDDEDNSAVLSVAWVEMPDAEAADDLKRLVDRPGTGNVTELSKQDGPYQDVRYSGWYYRSDVDGATFRSVQAEPLADNEGSREVARRASGATAID